MKTVIYIRHGPDEHSGHKYDEQLTKEGKREAKELAFDLLERYGVPDVIYYSPFYRTRQTRKAMISSIKKYKKSHGIDKNVELIIDPRLGRYFSRSQQRNPDIKSITINKGAIIEETKHEFKERVRSQMEEVLNNEYANIWNITHTLVLLKVAKFQNISRDKYVRYLDTVILEK